MKFFKPEDFIDDPSVAGINGQLAADLANAKLEREGKVVFSISSDRRYWEDPNDPTTQDASERCDLRALLINIEKIERCSHPAEKIKRDYMVSHDDYDFVCECGYCQSREG